MSTDDGGSWSPAQVEAGHTRHVGLAALDVRLAGDAGRARVLACRARDTAGHEQPLEPEWNLGGYVNNAVQRVPVTVT